MRGDYVRELAGPMGGLAQRQTLAQRLHIDLPLLLLLMVLTLFGLFVLYSGSNGNHAIMKRQITFFIIAYAGMFTIAQLSVPMLKRMTPWLYLGGLLLLVLVPLVGVQSKGAQRWLDFPGLPRFQPSEAIKLVVPMAVAWYLSSRVLPPRFKYVVVALGIIAVPTLLILVQPDLGTSILICASGLFVLLLAGLPWRYVLFALAGLVASAPLLWQFVLKPYQKQRILTLLNPEDDKLGAGWNIMQSKTAIGSGGIHGKGWMNGTQSHLEFLPESHTDFIIAVLAEEFGLIGVALLLVLYLLIVARGLLIGLQAQDMYGRLLAGSITLTFFVYVFVNMGMVSGLLPVVGVPLPLVSKGGTSIVTLMAGFGVLMAISTSRRRLIE